MIRIVFILFISLSTLGTGTAQVSINEDFPIDMMMRRFSEINNSNEFVQGWRIQIMAKTDRQAIEQEKENFLQEFPGVTVDWTHSKPYYRLRAGAFQTKLEAVKVMQQIKRKYPGSFPVKDNISKQEFIRTL